MTTRDSRRIMGDVVWFIGLTTAVTWLCYLPLILAARATGELDRESPLALLGLLAVLAPTLTACALAAVRGGRQELRRLLGSAVRWRFPLRWYLVVLLVPFAVPLAAVAADAAVSGNAPTVWLAAPAAQTLATFCVAPIGEDLGWRGYALSRMLDLWSPVITCLVLGPVWALWHLPMAFVPGTAQADQSFLLFTVQVTGATMIFTRVFLATRGSVLAMILMHGAANLAFNTVPVFSHEGGNATRTALLSVLYLVAGVLALVTLPRGSAAPGVGRAWRAVRYASGGWAQRLGRLRRSQSRPITGSTSGTYP